MQIQKSRENFIIKKIKMNIENYFHVSAHIGTVNEGFSTLVLLTF